MHISQLLRVHVVLFQIEFLMFIMTLQIGKAFLSQARRYHSVSNNLNFKKNLPKLPSTPPFFPRRSFTVSSISHTKGKLQCEIKNESVFKILQSSSQLLKESKISEPDLSVCHLLSFALKDDFKWEDNGFSTLYNILSDNNDIVEDAKYQSIKHKELTEEEFNTFIEMMNRRLTSEPLQYIIGKWDFHDITLNIRKPCLCPRPETEELVEIVGKEIQSKIIHRKNILQVEKKIYGRDKPFKKIRVLDVGCGTGAISIALANMFSPEEVEFVAIDIAEEAIQLTKENAEMVLTKSSKHEKDSYYQSFLCSAGDYTNTNRNQNNENKSIDSERYEFGFDIVVSNPPYIPKQDMTTLEEDVVGYEDHEALCGGDDGLDVIRDIVNRLPEWCSKEGVVEESICWMEVDSSHPKLIEDWLSNPNSSNAVEYAEGLNDLFGLPRFVKLRHI